MFRYLAHCQSKLKEMWESVGNYAINKYGINYLVTS